MVSMRALMLGIVALTCSISSAEAADYEYDGWPGEGIPGFSVKSAPLKLNRTPSKESEVISVPAEMGENILNAGYVKHSKLKSRFTYDKSKVITKKSVIWVARTTVTDFNCERTPVLAAAAQQPVIQAGEKIEMLQYRAEGYVLARYKGVVCEVFAADSPAKFGGMDKDAEAEWWIRVVNPDNEVLGWLLVDESQINYLARNS